MSDHVVNSRYHTHSHNHLRDKAGETSAGGSFPDKTRLSAWHRLLEMIRRLLDLVHGTGEQVLEGAIPEPVSGAAPAPEPVLVVAGLEHGIW